MSEYKTGTKRKVYSTNEPQRTKVELRIRKFFYWFYCKMIRHRTHLLTKRIIFRYQIHRNFLIELVNVVSSTVVSSYGLSGQWRTSLKGRGGSRRENVLQSHCFKILNFGNIHNLKSAVLQMPCDNSTIGIFLNSQHKALCRLYETTFDE